MAERRGKLERKQRKGQCSVTIDLLSFGSREEQETHHKKYRGRKATKRAGARDTRWGRVVYVVSMAIENNPGTATSGSMGGTRKGAIRGTACDSRGP